eukprot:1160185-Pelagomonas_calceolata.AAC.17
MACLSLAGSALPMQCGALPYIKTYASQKAACIKALPPGGSNFFQWAGFSSNALRWCAAQELESELKDATVERMRLALHHDPSGGHHQVKGSNKETAARLSEILSMQKELEVGALVRGVEHAKGGGGWWLVRSCIPCGLQPNNPGLGCRLCTNPCSSVGPVGIQR